MTDSEKLDLILAEMQDMKTEMQDMKQKITEIDLVIRDLKERIALIQPIPQQFRSSAV